MGRSPVTSCLPNQFLHLRLSFLQSHGGGSCWCWVQGNATELSHPASSAHGPQRHLDVPGCPNSRDLPAPCPLGSSCLTRTLRPGHPSLPSSPHTCKARMIPAALSEIMCVSLKYRCVSGGPAWSLRCGAPSSAAVLVQQRRMHRVQLNQGGGVNYFAWAVGEHAGERFLLFDDCYRSCNN